MDENLNQNKDVKKEGGEGVIETASMGDGEKSTESRRGKNSLFLIFSGVLLVVLGVLIDRALEPMRNGGVPADPNVVVDERVARLEKKLEDVDATAEADKLKFIWEMTTARAELTDAKGEIEAQRVVINEAKLSAARAVDEKVRGFLVEKAEIKKEFESRLASNNNEWELKVASLKAEISSLENRIKILCEENLKLGSAHNDSLCRKDAERDAEVKALRGALEKALREKNELLARVLRMESRISISEILSSWKGFNLPTGERFYVEPCVEVRPAFCGKVCVEVFLKKRIDGKKVSVEFLTTRERAEKLNDADAWVRFSVEDVVVKEKGEECGRLRLYCLD